MFQRKQFISRDGHEAVHFQQRLAAVGIRQLSSRPAHPQTCGKLERYHRTSRTSTTTTDPPPRSTNSKHCVTDSAGTTTLVSRASS
jgi:hypothetical protein